MKKNFREDILITSETSGRSGLHTEHMNSTTPELPAGTSWRNILVDENGEVMVGGGFQYVGYANFSEGTGFSDTPSTDSEFIGIVNTDSPVPSLVGDYLGRFGIYKRQVITDYAGFLSRVNDTSGKGLTPGQQYRINGLSSSIVSTTGVDLIVEAISSTDVMLHGALYTNVLDTDGSNEIDYVEVHFDKNRAEGFIVMRRRDKRGNDISASLDFITKCYNPINRFMWGKDNILENIAQNSQIDLRNYVHKSIDFITGNTVIGTSYANKDLVNTDTTGIIIDSTNIETTPIYVRNNSLSVSNIFSSLGGSTLSLKQSAPQTTIGLINIDGNLLVGSNINGNIFTGQGSISSNSVYSGSISNNNLSGNGKIERNVIYASGTIGGSSIGDNIISGSGRIDWNTIFQGGIINNNTMTGGRIFANIIQSYGQIYKFNLLPGLLQNNSLFNCTVGQSNDVSLPSILSAGGSFSYNELASGYNELFGITTSGGRYNNNSFKNAQMGNGGISRYSQTFIFNQLRDTVNAKNWSPIGLNHIQDLVLSEEYSSICGRVTLGGITPVSTPGNPSGIMNDILPGATKEYTLQGNSTNFTTVDEINFAETDFTALYGTILVTPNVPVLHNYKVKNPGFYGIWATSGNNRHTVSILRDKILFAQRKAASTLFQFSNNISDFHNLMLSLGFVYDSINDEYNITGTSLGYEYIEFGFNHSPTLGPLPVGGPGTNHSYPHKSYRLYFEKTTTNPVYEVNYFTDKPRHDVKIIPDSRIDLKINLIDSTVKRSGLENMQESVLPAAQIKLPVTRKQGQPSSIILKGGTDGDYAILSSSPYSHDKLYIKDSFTF